MTSDRLESFSDGVFAIIITIMVLELEAPKEYTLDAIFEISPTFMSYFMSFLYISIYWICHQQLFIIVKKVNGKILWANLHLLFWMSLIPFTTDWIGEGNHHTDLIPILVYGFVLLMTEASFLFLKKSVVKFYGIKSKDDRLYLDYIFLIIYIASLFLAFFKSYLAIACFLLVGLLKVTLLKRISEEV